MNNAPRTTRLLSFVLPSLSPIIIRSHVKWISTLPPPRHPTVLDHLRTFFRNRGQPASEFAMVSALKSCSSPLDCQQIHSLVSKSGLASNIFVYNSLIKLYGKCGLIETARLMFDSAPSLNSASWNTMIVGYVKSGRVDDALCLFEEMPERDCVSFTTMIMGFAQSGQSIEALRCFQEMMVTSVVPNEVTLASVMSACVNLGAVRHGKIVHGLVIKCGFQSFVLVSTNLVHMYAVCSCVADAEVIFYEMPEQNIVTWNVMLKGYVKSGFIDSARALFDRIPERDLVSWNTMINGYVRMDRLPEALVMYREMLRAEVKPNDVTIVDLVLACGRSSTTISEGQQFHGVVSKTGLDCHVFVQATIIHFYAACQQIDLACLQFQWADKDHLSSWNALITGFLRNNMVDSARKLFDEMHVRDVISWSSMIAGYAQSGQFHLALDLFHDMQLSGLRPNEITMVSVVSAIAHAGTLKQGRLIHNYILENSIPINDNLSAGLIDMYAKRGNIRDALEVFYHIQDQTCSICPWNAMISGLAMHGHADKSLKMFADLQKTDIKPNSITFIGVLTACCHAGLVDAGRQYFGSMKNIYKIEPNIKHYGCMVDLLGRSGRLKEAERLIESMPMKADVVIWGTMLAACRTHGNVEIGERAAESLTKLEPSHGAGRVLLSNIYAEAGRWDDVLLVRKAMQSGRVKKLPGYSGVM